MPKKICSWSARCLLILTCRRMSFQWQEESQDTRPILRHVSGPFIQKVLPWFRLYCLQFLVTFERAWEGVILLHLDTGSSDSMLNVLLEVVINELSQSFAGLAFLSKPDQSHPHMQTQDGIFVPIFLLIQVKRCRIMPIVQEIERKSSGLISGRFYSSCGLSQDLGWQA